QAEALRGQTEEFDEGVRVELARRVAELRTARASVPVAAAAVDSARENLRVVRDRYTEGLVPSSELLDAETALLPAGLDVTQAPSRVKSAAATLARSAGL